MVANTSDKWLETPGSVELTPHFLIEKHQLGFLLIFTSLLYSFVDVSFTLSPFSSLSIHLHVYLNSFLFIYSVFCISPGK